MQGFGIQKYFSKEIEALIVGYQNFEKLLPARSDKYNKKRGGSSHYGEEGRFIEALIKTYLKRFLPNGLELLSGFILKPAVKTGKDGYERKGKKDEYSSQLDIIVFDSINYPIFNRYENCAIVPPEGVIAIISVKKHLYNRDIIKECNALLKAVKLCSCQGLNKDKKVRMPFTAIVSVKPYKNGKMNGAFKQLAQIYKPKPLFDETIGYIGALEDWSIFKKSPPKIKQPDVAIYTGFKHDARNRYHLGLQFLLTGIFSVYYDETRNNKRRPGFTAFPSTIEGKLLGKIKVNGLR